jgi:DNA-directed RNA polymerase specialized sigma54-like protein
MGVQISVQQSQKVIVTQAIELSNLMSIPDQVLSAVYESALSNPESMEAALVNTKANKPGIENASAKIMAVYPVIGSQAPSAGKGIIISPDIKTLENQVQENIHADIKPDVIYTGRESQKPELEFSNHLSGSLTIKYELDKKRYPQTSRLLAAIRRFNEWKKRTLRDAYVIIGDVQREYFEGFDYTKCNILTQQNLAERLNIDDSIVSRILSNRWVMATNISRHQKRLETKSLIITHDDLRKYSILPMLNDLLEEEFNMKKAYSDYEISKRIPYLARRTLTKYRNGAEIPVHSIRHDAYRTGERNKPYVMPAPL